MQSVSSRIWTRIAVFISYGDNDYTTGTIGVHHLRARPCFSSSVLIKDDNIVNLFKYDDSVIIYNLSISSTFSAYLTLYEVMLKCSQSDQNGEDLEWWILFTPHIYLSIYLSIYLCSWFIYVSLISLFIIIYQFLLIEKPLKTWRASWHMMASWHLLTFQKCFPWWTRLDIFGGREGVIKDVCDRTPFWLIKKELNHSLCKGVVLLQKCCGHSRNADGGGLPQCNTFKEKTPWDHESSHIKFHQVWHLRKHFVLLLLMFLDSELQCRRDW